MNARVSLFVALVLLVVTRIGGSLALGPSQLPGADKTYLPFIQKQEPVKIQSVYIYFSRYQDYIVAGTITDLAYKTAYDVTVRTSLFSDNELVDVITSTTALPATFPYDHNYFGFYYDYPGLDIDQVEATVISWSFSHDPEYLPLTVLSVECFCGYELGTLTGEIRNDNPFTITDIVGMYRPGLDQPFGHFFPNLTTLAPGEQTTFEVGLIYPPYINGENYTVLAQGAIE